MNHRRPAALIAAAALALALGCQPAARVEPRPAGSVLPSAEPGNPAAAGLRPGAHQVVINDVRLWYRVAGEAPPDAPPVVFLHGGPGQGSAHFAALAGPWLERSLRMVYLDQRGSGYSERPWTNEYSMELLVEDLEGLRQTLGVPRLALIGQSFGAALALEYAAAYPEQVSHLVFVAGLWDTVLQCRHRLERLGELRPEAYARVRTDTLAADGTRRSDCDLEFQAFSSAAEREAYNMEVMFPDPAVPARMDSVNAAHGIRNTGELGRALFTRGLTRYRFAAHERLTMPVLVLAGRHDGAALPAGHRELARRLPNARYVEYENSGHFPYLDEPERFARDVAQFLAAPPSPGD